MSLTAAQILDLAPDASSRKAGQDQGNAAKWSVLAGAGAVIWGEIKGRCASRRSRARSTNSTSGSAT